MAAGDPVAAFLETSLGTRFAVSFPARGTTFADLKRLVIDEHFACFPRMGPIAVTSLQVKIDALLYVLSDRMDVQAAFRGVEGTWHLWVEADQLSPPPRPIIHGDAECGAGNSEQSLDPGVAAYKDNGLVGGQRKDIIVSTRGRKCSREEDENGESTVVYNDGILTLLATSTVIARGNRSEQANLGLLYNSHGLGKKLSFGQMEAWAHGLCNGASSNSGSDIAPCFKSMKEYISRLTSSIHYLDKAEFEGAPSAVIAEHETCFPRRKWWVAAQKVPLSMARNMYAFRTEQANLGYDLGYHSLGLRVKPLPGQMEPQTSGLCNGESSMEGENSSDKEVRADGGKEEDLRIAGLCNDENKCNETEIHHCVESTKEDSRRPTSSDYYLNKGQYEGSTPTITYHRKRAMLPKKETVGRSAQSASEHGKKDIRFQECSKTAVRSSSRINNKGVPVGQNTVKRKIDHNLEVPGVDTGLFDSTGADTAGSPDQFAQEQHMVKDAVKSTKKKKITKTKKLSDL